MIHLGVLQCFNFACFIIPNLSAFCVNYTFNLKFFSIHFRQGMQPLVQMQCWRLWDIRRKKRCRSFVYNVSTIICRNLLQTWKLPILSNLLICWLLLFWQEKKLEEEDEALIKSLFLQVGILNNPIDMYDLQYSTIFCCFFLTKN